VTMEKRTCLPSDRSLNADLLVTSVIQNGVFSQDI
jgi:hypothetical protein